MRAVVLFICACLFSAHFISCKKTDDENDGSVVARRLKAGKWQLSGSIAELNYQGRDTTVNVFGQIEECDRDDFILFNDNGVVTIDENMNKCAKDTQIETGWWTLLDNDTRITLVDSNPDTYNLQVSDTDLKLWLTKPNGSGIPVRYTSIYKNIR